MKSIELFSGTGGLALGLQQAAFDHEALFEWDKDSCENIKYNIANHDPGKGRHSGKMPFWDCLHPGRAWADRLQPCAFTAEELDRRVREYLNEALS